MSHLNLPFDELLRVPGPDREPPDATVFEERIEQWLAGHDVITDGRIRARVRATRPGELALHVDPGMSQQLLELSGLQMGCMFALDGHLEQLGGSDPADLVPVVCALLAVLDGEVPRSRTPWIRALAELRWRVRELATPLQFLRWAENVRYFLHAVLMERVQRATGLIAELDICLTVRLYSGGCLMWYPLFEMACAQPPTPEQLADPDVERLMRSSANIAAWINDLFSLTSGKRMRLPTNLALAHLRTNGGGLTDAVSNAAAHVNQETARFLSLRDEVSGRGDAPDATYLDGMTRWISGTFRWSRNAPRAERFSLATVESQA